MRLDCRVIFKPISREEFERMSLNDRMGYLHLLMSDLQKKLKDTRQQQEAVRNKLPKL